MIKKRSMGRTGLKLSELCLGTLNFGWKTDEPTAFALLDAYRAAGGNFIQTASHAPGLLPSASVSASEEVVGRWLACRRIPRHEWVLATRLYVRPSPQRGQSFVETVRNACHSSLRRLQIDQLDLVIFEWNDGLLPMHDTLEAFDAVVRTGLARYLGAGNFPVWRVADALGRTFLRNQCRIEAIQADYSLMTRARFEPEALALCQEQRLGFFARSPLAGGFLTREDGLGNIFNPSRRDWLSQRFDNIYGQTALDAVSTVAAQHDATAAQVALAWVLHNPAVTSAIIGVNSTAQLHGLLRAGQLHLSADDIARLGDATVAEEIRVAPRTAPRRTEPRLVLRN